MNATWDSLIDGPKATLRAVVLRQAAAPVSYTFTQSHILVGSDPSCEIVLPDKAIRNVHLEVAIEPSGAVVIDQSGGICLYNGAVFRTLPLPSQTSVHVALAPDLTISFVLLPQAKAGRPSVPVAKRTEGASPSGRVRAANPARDQTSTQEVPSKEEAPKETGIGGALQIMMITGAHRQPFRIAQDQDVLIGRAATCSLQTPQDAESISSEHARLQWSNGWLLLEDLETTNGTRYGGDRVSTKILRPGAEHSIELAGEVVLKVRILPRRSSAENSASTNGARETMRRLSVATTPRTSPSATSGSAHSQLTRSPTFIACVGDPRVKAQAARAVEFLRRRNGIASAALFATELGVEAIRVRGVVSRLQEMLNIDGYQVLRFDSVGNEVHLDLEVLAQQFGVEFDNE